MRDVNSERDEANRGSAEEFPKLAATVAKVDRDNNLWFDQAAFTPNVSVFMAIPQAN